MVVQPRDVQPNEDIKLKDLVRVKVDALKDEQRIMRGDVLLTNRGKFESAVFWSNTAEAVINSHSVLSLRVNLGEIIPDYLALYLNSKAGQVALNRIGQTSTVPFIGRANLEELIIPVPSMERQRALIELGKTKWKFDQLSRRKVELLDKILRHEFTGAPAQEEQ